VVWKPYFSAFSPIITKGQVVLLLFYNSEGVRLYIKSAKVSH